MRPEIRTRLTTARADLASLSDYETHLWSRIQFLLDAILGFINTDQNDIFKVLTIVSVSFFVRLESLETSSIRSAFVIVDSVLKAWNRMAS